MPFNLLDRQPRGSDSDHIAPAAKPPLAPKSRFDSALSVVLLAGALYLGFVGLRLARHGFDPSYFVTAGDRVVDPRQVPPGLQVLPDSAGYDGQYYYRLALDPLTDQTIAYGIPLDAFRQQRIVYPTLVWLASLGRPELVPAMLIAVNFVALLGIAALGAYFARLSGHHALWGLLVALWPGFLFSLSRDLTEIVAGAFLLFGLLLARLGRQPLAAGALTLAALARETTVLVAPIAAVFGLMRRTGQDQSSFRGLSMLAPAGCLVVWQSFLFWRWGSFPFQTGTHAFGPPGLALATFLAEVSSPDTLPKRAYAVELCLLIALTCCAGWALRRGTAPTYEKVTWCVYGLLVLCGSGLVWLEEHWGFMRLLTEYALFGGLIVLSSPSRRVRAVALGATLLLWIISAGAILKAV